MLTNPEEILGVACREVIRLVGGDTVMAAYCRPGERWEQGSHIVADAERARRIEGAGTSAMFAVYRRASQHRAALAIERGPETEAIFAGLGVAAATVIRAIPIVHRGGRLWGVFVVVGAPSEESVQVIEEIAQFVMVALENAQRLAFARRDQDRLLLLAEATHDALYDWNFDTREFWWGGGILKLLGSATDPVETTARWKLERIHPDDRERVRLSLEAARFSKAITWRDEYRFQRADGLFLQVEDQGYFLRETDGRAYRMIGSIRDVTPMKSLLEREQAARSDAERASRAKDEFLAMLGHELRNPLAPIVTGLQLIRLRGGSNADKELTVLERQAQHLIRLVDDLLDISRIAHAKIALKKERLEIANVIAMAIETASPLIESRQHTLSVEVASSGLEVEADRARLAQAVGNLLTNAAKYTEPGGQIAVRVRRENGWVVISIRDNGIGIASDMLPTIFNMFVQERQALDRSQGGLGLGLSIVRSLIELHGGTVIPHSEGRGKGSEFTVRIPIAPPSQTSDAPAVTPTRRRRATGRRIFVVDDNEDAADLLALMLERIGHTTRVANDASRALAVIDEFSPDLAVLDIGLPVIDGYELARRLRENPATKYTKLIALTGYGQASDKERATKAGFDAHLVKPVSLESIEAAIDRLLVVDAGAAVRDRATVAACRDPDPVD
jgi:signal transduction histidine kinase/ActR/RegA family two-component response regulator